MEGKELEEWFNIWVKKKIESDYLFPTRSIGWLWLAFVAGAHVAQKQEEEPS